MANNTDYFDHSNSLNVTHLPAAFYLTDFTLLLFQMHNRETARRIERSLLSYSLDDEQDVDGLKSNLDTEKKLISILHNLNEFLLILNGINFEDAGIFGKYAQLYASASQDNLSESDHDKLSDLEDQLKSLREQSLEIANEPETQDDNALEKIRFMELMIQLEHQFHSEKKNLLNQDLDWKSPSSGSYKNFVEKTLQAYIINRESMSSLEGPYLPFRFADMVDPKVMIGIKRSEFMKFEDETMNDDHFLITVIINLLVLAIVLLDLASPFLLVTAFLTFFLIQSIVSLFNKNTMRSQFNEYTESQSVFNIFLCHVIAVSLYIYSSPWYAVYWAYFVFSCSVNEIFTSKENLLQLGDLMTFEILTNNFDGIDSDENDYLYAGAYDTCEGYSENNKESFKSFLLGGIFDQECTWNDVYGSNPQTDDEKGSPRKDRRSSILSMLYIVSNGDSPGQERKSSPRNRTSSIFDIFNIYPDGGSPEKEVINEENTCKQS